VIRRTILISLDPACQRDCPAQIHRSTATRAPSPWSSRTSLMADDDVRLRYGCDQLADRGV